jgi:hypothetical protein
VVEPRGKTDLAEEAFETQRSRELGVKHLKRHRPIVLEVAAKVHCGHPTTPELALKCVAVSEGGSKRVAGSGHGRVGTVAPPLVMCHPLAVRTVGRHVGRQT